jgi:hypothetical protein
MSKFWWRRTIDDAIIEFPRWLGHMGFIEFAPALREDLSACGSAVHPKIAPTAKGGERPNPPVWLRLRRLKK